MLNNKRGQVAETMTWVVATLIIIVLLSISIYATTILANAKSVSSKTESVFSLGYSRTQDVVMENSLFAYFQINDSSVQAKIGDDLSSRAEQGYFYADFDSKLKKLKAYLE